MRSLAFACALLALGDAAAEQAPAAATGHGAAHRHGATSQPPAFQAAGSVPFANLMANAMAVMDDGMRRAPMNGDAGHDFVTMMLPHHQGAIDMAKAELKHGDDPWAREVAQAVISAQEKEIADMLAWLEKQAQ